MDPRGRVRWDSPRCRVGPIAAVDQPGRPICQAGWLSMRQRCRELDARRHPAGSHPRVVAHSIDVDSVCAGVCVDLEADSLTYVDADIGGEALDARITGRRADIPLAGRISRIRVLVGDRVRLDWIGWGGLRVDGRDLNQDQRCKHDSDIRRINSTESDWTEAY